MIGICDEVANGKIAGRFVNKDPLIEEGQFNHTSLIDFQDNIPSVGDPFSIEAAQDAVRALQPVLETKLLPRAQKSPVSTN